MREGTKAKMKELGATWNSSGVEDGHRKSGFGRVRVCGPSHQKAPEGSKGAQLGRAIGCLAVSYWSPDTFGLLKLARDYLERPALKTG